MQLTSYRELAPAYSPVVAAACETIAADPADASRQAARANLVGAIANGTAVLGRGDIGSLAARPVIEGKGALIKTSAGIDAANIGCKLSKAATGSNVAIGPNLLNAAKPEHILTASATVRRIVDMTSFTVLDTRSPR